MKMISRNLEKMIHQMWASPKRVNMMMWKVKPTNMTKKDIMILAGQRTVSMDVLPKRSDVVMPEMICELNIHGVEGYGYPLFLITGQQ